MKIKLLLVVISIFLVSGCTNATKKKVVAPIKKKEAKATFDRLSSEFVIGDFDGDKVNDTLCEIHTSEKDGKIITQIPIFDDYDGEVKYYYKHDIQTTLKPNKSSISPLELGVSFGTYCLINIGDNNKDGKDELAVVIAYCDFSMMNSCKIYTLCGSDWKLINHFTVHENSFYHEENEKINPNQIEGYLEQKSGKWFYADAWEILQADDTLSKLKPLKIKKCY